MSEAVIKDECPFKWSDEHTDTLIRWRIEKQDLFTGKRNAAIKGFERFVVDNGLTGKVHPAWVKKKWENLKQKYKDLRCPKSGASTEEGEATAASWKWYGVMDAALGHKPSITPPVSISLSGQETVVVSTTAVASPVIQHDWSPLRKRRREESQLLSCLKQMEKREERREAERQAKEEQRCEEAARREEEARAREERREEEARAREERREVEARAREERREEEARAREERREEEARAREERRELEARRREEEAWAREERREEEARRREEEFRAREERREERFLALLDALLKK